MRRDRFGDTPRRYLAARTEVRVRFQEVDSLQVVWHGHYVSYFEEGRTAFGRQFGFDYPHILANGFSAPIVRVEVDYLAPANYGDVLTVETRLHPDQRAMLIFTYRVCAPDERLLATGRSVQAFTNLKGELIVTRPRFFEQFVAENEAALIEG